MNSIFFLILLATLGIVFLFLIALAIITPRDKNNEKENGEDEEE